MRAFLLLLVLCAACAKAPESTAPAPGAAQETYKAADGKPFFADIFRSKTPAIGVVLMFHQAGSNAGEYATIAPKIADQGFDCLAIDQRSGGDMWGRANRTVKATGGDKDYLAAYGDLVGTLQWAIGKHYKHIVAWGSSYSSSLVFKLASEHPEVSAVLSFSPGEYMDDKTVVKKWAAGVKVPVLLASTKDEWKDQAEAIYFAVPDSDKMSVATDNGIHGSSTLIEDKNPKGNAEYWKSVDAFFDKLKKAWKK